MLAVLCPDTCSFTGLQVKFGLQSGQALPYVSGGHAQPC